MCDTENMKIYSECRDVPVEAQKTITAGRLKNFTDVNPMWRIKKLTEMFGPCGFGWNLINETHHYEKSDETAEVACVYELDFVYKYNGEWSAPIHGVGGAMFVAMEKDGLYVDDEAVKKARTDAISVACKSIGVAASIYFSKDPDSKYEGGTAPAPQAPAKTAAPKQQAQAQAPAQKTETKTAPKTATKEQAPAKTPSKYQQVAALIKADTTEYWNMETVNEWISKTLGKDCRVNDLPDDVFAQLLERMRGQQ